MPRLPEPGKDAGNWGDILNDYLSQSLDSVGALKTDTVGAPQLKPNAVTNAALVDGTISEAKLASAVQTKLNTVPDKGAANGIATLDGNAKLQEAQVPTRLSETELNTTIDDAIQTALDGTSSGSTTLSSGPDIACFGDSLTAGSGGGGTSYPGVLQTLLGAGGYAGTVRNLGVGGESSRGIAARQGGRPALVTVTSGSIPTSGGVTVTTAYDDGVATSLLSGGTAGVNPVDIAGVRGTLSLSGGIYTFTRSASGTAVSVPFPVPLITQASRDRGADIQIYWMGQNDGLTSDASLVISRERAAIDKMTSAAKNWLVIGLSSGDSSSRATLDTQWLTEFGRRFINIRQWLSSSAALAAAGITPTSDDTTALAAGSVPRSFLNSPGTGDFVHLNAAGYTQVANYVYARLVELGYLTVADEPEVPPVTPLPTPWTIGVNDWDHRYIASDLTLGALTEWRDHGTTEKPLARASGDTGTIEAVLESSTTYVRFTAPEGVNARVSDNLPLAADTRTVALVMRYAQGTTASQGTFAQAHGLSLTRLTNQSTNLTGAGVSTISVASGFTIGTWRVYIFGVDSPLLAVNATEVTSAASWAPSSSSAFIAGMTGGTAGAGTRIVDIAEVIQWPRVLNSTERTAVRSALKTQYPVLP